MKQYLPLWIRLVSLCVIFQLHVFAQSKKISGVVKDDNGNLLPGASVGLNDLVAAGYGSVKEKELTGSVQRITHEEIDSNNPTKQLRVFIDVSSMYTFAAGENGRKYK